MHFENVAFVHPARAEDNLARLRPRLPDDALALTARLVAQLPDPDTALNALERFTAAAPDHIREYVGANRAALHHLLTIFAHSPYLADTLIQQPELLLWLESEPALHRVKSCEETLRDLKAFAGSYRGDLTATLARFKRREYLRIALRDFLRLATLPEAAMELSALADAILQFTLDYARRELIDRYGTPMIDTPAGAVECAVAIISMGKLGGNELNYSSDIDLIFLYRGNGETKKGISNKEYFVKLAHRVVGALTAFSDEGSVFRVDLRLRPQGREGDMATSLQGAVEYYRAQARDWELQALVKARHSAGDTGLSREFLDEVLPLIYRTSVNFAAIDSVLFARERISEALKRRASQSLGIDVKLERGGIRDIEFLAQCLQRLYGGQERWLRSGGTLFALQKLADKRYLQQRDFAGLSRAYLFLRNVEHLLQLERGQQTQRLPGSRELVAVLARRAGIERASQPPPGEDPQRHAAAALQSEVEKHMKRVREIYDRLINAHLPTEEGQSGFTLEPDAPITAGGGEQSYPDLMRRLEGTCPALYRIANEVPVTRGRKYLRRFLTRSYTSEKEFGMLCANPQVLESAAEIFEHSPFLSELLIRHPGEIAELSELPPAQAEPDDTQQRLAAEADYLVQDDPVLMHIAAADAPLTEKMMQFRRHYRRRLLHIHAHSLLGPVPVFATLEATSVLAEQVLRAAYVAAVMETARTMPRPAGELIVVSLGRLGIREFDIASDADLGFLYRGGDPEAKLFWTRVAERMIEVVSAYTGEGTIFAVDSRLRPRGREGELVEGEGAFAEYFASAAQPWEAITYMKSRVVAGDVMEGTVLLTRIQYTIHERFGRGRDAAAKLADTRKKQEAVATPHNRLKYAPGGYYDIDFILTYLRLQAARVFFPSLTTHERLRVVESMGQLSPAQAQVLRDAAVYLRAMEHALRLSTGRSDAEVPAEGPAAEGFQRLVARWLPPSLRQEKLEAVMARVRAIFKEIFA